MLLSLPEDVVLLFFLVVEVFLAAGFLAALPGSFTTLRALEESFAAAAKAAVRFVIVDIRSWGWCCCRNAITVRREESDETNLMLLRWIHNLHLCSSVGTAENSHKRCCHYYHELQLYVVPLISL